MNKYMKDRYAMNAYIIAILAAILCGTPHAMAQSNTQQELNGKYQELYVKAHKNTNNEQGPIIADSLIKIARAEGSVMKEIQARFIKLKHECEKPNNTTGVEREMKPIMSMALNNNLLEYFYSAVSHKVTYLTNHALYHEALSYQYDMLKYAKQHKHNYGVLLGHISLGNLYRMRLEMPQALDEYRQAIEGYKKYGIKNDLGRDYKRMAECCIIIGDFKKAMTYAKTGIDVTRHAPSEAGLHIYCAFAAFMLDDREKFEKEYAAYKSFSEIRADVIPFVQTCVETMKLIDDNKFSEAEEKLKKPGMGAFKPYVEMAYYKSRGNYAEMLKAMRKLHISLYGENRGTYTTDWAKMGEAINNNLNELDKQKAEYTYSILELNNMKLALTNNRLKLMAYKDAEHLAWAASEENKLSSNNRRLLSKQLSDSLRTLRLNHEAHIQKIKSDRTRIFTLLAIIAGILALALHYLRLKKKRSKYLKETNKTLTNTITQLSIAKDEAMESDKKKTEFIQEISHEVRTPLNAIVGFSQMLASGDIKNEDKEEIKKIITTNSDKLNILITNILDLTNIESGKYLMKEEKTNINAVCRDATEKASLYLTDGIDLTFHTSLPDTYTIWTDGQRVTQVLTNLLSNAIKNTEEGSVKLECQADEKRVTFSVTDTGSGIPEDKRQEIFQRFCKLDKFKQGTGLGLSICKEIAKRLNATIEIDTTYKEKGTRFVFRLPTGENK